VLHVGKVLVMLALGRDAERTMPTKWIHGGRLPPCPCGAPTEDQVRRPIGADRALWHCLICDRGRQPADGWVDDLVAISEDQWRARSRVMEARVRARWRASDPYRA
jgi:hypothetical protein